MYMTTALSMLTGLTLSLADEGAYAVCALASLAVAAVLYVAGVPRGRACGARGLRAFLNFDRLVVEPLAKFAYLALAVAGAVFTAATVALQAFGEGRAPSDVALHLAYAAGVLVVYEALLRAAFELVVLFVRAARVLAGGAAHGPAVPVGEGEGPERAPRAAAPVRAGATASAPSREPAAERDGVTVYPRSQAPAVPAGVPVVLPVASAFVADALDAPAEGEGACADGPAAEYVPAFEPDPEAGLGLDAEPRDVIAPITEDDAFEEGCTYPRESLDAYAVFDAQSSVLWDCACGAVDNYGAFCGNCGTPRPSKPRQDGARVGGEAERRERP